MKFDVFKILQAINIGMSIAETFREKKSKIERLQHAKAVAAPLVSALEAALGKDLLHEEKIEPLVDEYVAIVIKLSKAVDEVKALRVKDETKG